MAMISAAVVVPVNVANKALVVLAVVLNMVGMVLEVVVIR